MKEKVGVIFLFCEILRAFCFFGSLYKDIMLEDKLPELIRTTYNLKVLICASYKAKETLIAKGLTPAVFFDRFYREKANDKAPYEVGYTFKDRYIRPLPEFITID